MKVFISCDIEGVAGSLKWQETHPDEKYYHIFAKEMTDEAVSLCKAAIDAGATEIVVKDSHGPGTNMDFTAFPEEVKIVRGWEHNPLMMVECVDKSFDAIAFVGYHSEAGNPGNPMSHTMTGKTTGLKMNGVPLSEFRLYSLCAAELGVPCVFLSGDKALCQSSKKLYPWIKTAAMKEGFGESVKSLVPAKAHKLIYEEGLKAFKQDLKAIPLPEELKAKEYVVEVSYKEHTMATKMSYFPGCKKVGTHGVTFKAKSVYEAARTLMFIL